MSEGWLIAALTGVVTGFLAATIDLSVKWLANLKEGYCVDKWVLPKETCCASHEGTVPCRTVPARRIAEANEKARAAAVCDTSPKRIGSDHETSFFFFPAARPPMSLTSVTHSSPIFHLLVLNKTETCEKWVEWNVYFRSSAVSTHGASWLAYFFYTAIVRSVVFCSLVFWSCRAAPLGPRASPSRWPIDTSLSVRQSTRVRPCVRPCVSLSRRALFPR